MRIVKYKKPQGYYNSSHESLIVDLTRCQNQVESIDESSLLLKGRNSDFTFKPANLRLDCVFASIVDVLFSPWQPM